MEAAVKGSMRGLVVGVVICSWLTISNHCAFAAVTAKSDPAQSECPFHHSKPKPKSPSAGIQCCKILRAVVAITPKSWSRDDAKFSNVDVPAERLILITSGYGTAPLLLDTGPPGPHSFAELILQESLLAHAPPSRS